ncbi:MAG: cysteine desulfurase family protein [Acidimicrobiales bacterium]
MEPSQIYLDHNATTPLAGEALSAMLPFLEHDFGNPSSSHGFGSVAKEAVEQGRSKVAALLGCAPTSVVFTSGGTEADNLAIKGVALRALQEPRTPGARPPHIVTTSIEHPAVLRSCEYLQRNLGIEVTRVGVDSTGTVDPDDIAKAIRPETILVSVMHANNEVGTVQPITQIARVSKERGVLFHTDAAQSVGKIPVDVSELEVDLLSIAGHKVYAPKGIGALYLGSNDLVTPLLDGAAHEQGLRAGTENVAAIVALGAACVVASSKLAGGAGEQMEALRDRLHASLDGGFADLELNGHPVNRLPNTLNVSFLGRDGEVLLERTRRVAAATGAACHSGRTEPSEVLMAMGLSRRRALGAIRLSLGYATTRGEVDEAAQALLTAATAP